MASTPSLLGIPLELRTMILKIANLPVFHPRPIIPVDKSNGIVHQGANWNVREIGRSIKYFRAGGTIEHHPMLAVNRQLYTETLKILHKNQRGSIYPLDLLLVNDSELWVTWLSTPIIVDYVEKIDIKFRNAGFVTGKQWIDQGRQALFYSDDDNTFFRYPFSNIILEILERRLDGHYKDAGRKLRSTILAITVYYTAHQRRQKFSIPDRNFAMLQWFRNVQMPRELYMNEEDIRTSVYDLVCRLRPNDYHDEEHPITPAIFESLNYIHVDQFHSRDSNTGCDSYYTSTIDVNEYFERLQWDIRWYYHPFFPEEVFRAWKASMRQIRVD